MALHRFNELVITHVGGTKYDHIMLIDGNDERGIDVGIMTRSAFNITSIISHVDDNDENGQIFSRDCPEYYIKTPSGNTLLVLVNHFKSKGYGSQAENDSKRERQATRVKDIYKDRVDQGFQYIAIVGDLNDIPNRPPLKPLLNNELGLTDVMNHTKFISDGKDGKYGNGTKSNKIDYILISSKLSDKVI